MAINNFYFTGEAFIPKQSDKFGFVMGGKTSNGEYLRMNLGVKESEHNIAFTEMFGMKQKTITTFDTDKNKIEINWDDRFDEDIVGNVASYRKTTVNFAGLKVNETETLREKFDECGASYEVSNGEITLKRSEFLSSFDAIKYIGAVSEFIKDKKILVTGQLRMNPYNGKFTKRYEIQNVYLAKEEDKNLLRLSIEVYFNKDSYDGTDWKSEKIVTLNGYVPMYVNKDEGTKFMPLSLVFNCSKADENNEKQMKRVEYNRSYLEAPNSKKMYKMVYHCKVLNGSEEVEITYDMLTDKQKESIDLGIFTLDNFKKKTFGERVQEIRYTSPGLDFTEFDNGIVEADETVKEFEEMIYTFSEAKVEKLDEVIKEEPEESKEAEVDDDDLFG